MQIKPLKSLLGLILSALLFNVCLNDDSLKEFDTLRNQLFEIQKRNDELNKILNSLAVSFYLALMISQKKLNSLATFLKTRFNSLSMRLGNSGNLEPFKGHLIDVRIYNKELI